MRFGPRHTDRHRKTETYGKMATVPQAKEYLGHQKLEEMRKELSLEASEGAWP